MNESIALDSVLRHSHRMALYFGRGFVHFRIEYNFQSKTAIHFQMRYTLHCQSEFQHGV